MCFLHSGFDNQLFVIVHWKNIRFNWIARIFRFLQFRKCLASGNKRIYSLQVKKISVYKVRSTRARFCYLQHFLLSLSHGPVYGKKVTTQQYQKISLTEVELKWNNQKLKIKEYYPPKPILSCENYNIFWVIELTFFYHFFVYFINCNETTNESLWN